MQKINRYYKAEFYIYKKKELEKVITIESPIALDLQTDIRISNQPSMGNFQFLNLSHQVQADLWFDYWDINSLKSITMILYAGYRGLEKNLIGSQSSKDAVAPMIFKGKVINCTSQKASGATDWITQVQAFEGGDIYKYGFINTTFLEYTKFDDVVKYMLEQDPDTKIGCISPDMKPVPKNKTFIGQTMDILGREYGNYEVFIDKGQLNVLGNNDIIKGEVLALTSETGLLGSPRRANVFVEVDMIFEPQVRIGQAVSLLSDSMSKLNQLYKVNGIKHNGVIDECNCGNLTTTLTLSAFSSKPREVEVSKGTVYSGSASSQWNKPVQGKISDPYGMRLHPIKKTNIFHDGIDISAPLGSAIKAPANGTVINASWKGGYGKFIQINHGTINGKEVISSYGHLQSINVSVGQKVYQNDTVIGLVGSSGTYADGTPSSTGPHLHFEIREDNHTVDPSKYIGNY